MTRLLLSRRQASELPPDIGLGYEWWQPALRRRVESWYANAHPAAQFAPAARAKTLRMICAKTAASVRCVVPEIMIRKTGTASPAYSRSRDCIIDTAFRLAPTC